MIMPKEWTYYKSKIYPKGIYLPKEKVCISPNDRGFMFGDGVYEVIRTYKGKFYRLTCHLDRLKRSLDAVRIDYPDIDLNQVLQELLELNKLQKGDATIYIQITRGVFKRTHTFPPQPIPPTVYIEASRFIASSNLRSASSSGVAVITVSDFRWARCDIKAVGLLPNVLARQQAIERGAQEAIFVRDGVVTEGTHTNVFGVKDGKVLTYPKSNYILAGITRDTVFKLCAHLQIPIIEALLPENKLFELDELFLAGTTVEITPVIKVNQKLIGKGRPGEITKILQKAFWDEIRQR
uniref:D-alanine aminotransferase n=1 Tax=candidate division WOR-3 bacterium TaxID=2052148 RepID=A0A7C6EAJ2_UNCW3